MSSRVGLSSWSVSAGCARTLRRIYESAPLLVQLQTSKFSGTRTAERCVRGFKSRCGAADALRVQQRWTSGSVNKSNAATTSDQGEDLTLSIKPGRTQSWWTSWFQRIGLAAQRHEPNFLLRVLGYYSEESQALRLGKTLYRDTLREVEAWQRRLYGEISGDKPVDVPLAAWVQLTSLHLWVTIYRLRAEGEFGRQVSQALYENFWPHLRQRLAKDLGLGLVEASKQMRECEHMFFGAAIRYDEAWLNKDQEAFIAALQRNIPRIGAEQARVLYDHVAQQLRGGRLHLER